jgi:hypothetical protein
MWYFAHVCVCVRGEELTEDCRQAVMFHIPDAFLKRQQRAILSQIPILDAKEKNKIKSFPFSFFF